MKRFVLLTLCLLALFLFLAPQSQSKAASAPLNTVDLLSPPTNQIIIKYEASAQLRGRQAANAPERLAQLSAVAGVPLTYVRLMSGDAHVLRLPERLPMSQVQAMAAKLTRLADVDYAEPDAILQIGDQQINPERLYADLDLNRIPGQAPNDTNYSSQWHYRYAAGVAEGINAEPAWDVTTGSASIVVAVVDTGILNHADLAGRTVAGYDMINDVAVANDGDGRDGDPSDPGDWVVFNECGGNNSPSDSSWHGTHVAGTVGAATNNAMGVAGINWNAKIQPVRVLGKCGGYTSDIADGIRWAGGVSVPGTPANATPAKVLNLSLGGFGSCATTTQSAIDAITANGSIMVVAAGNSNDNAANYNPANCNNVITVASNGPSGNRAYYSNYGNVVEVTAPGGDTSGGDADGVLSTLNNGTTSPTTDAYVYYQGTSMASPHVAGVASLIVSICPSYNFTQVLSRLQATVRPFPAGSSCNTSLCGSGIVDATNAVTGLTCSPPPSTYHIYLPIALKSQPVTPPSTIPNGDFESGHVSWTEYSSHGYDLILNSFAPTSVTPHGGSWGVWLGGDDLEDSDLSQVVTVPASAPYLGYWHLIGSSDNLCGWDVASVQINGSGVDILDLCTSQNTSGWEKRVVDLSAYSGQTVTLAFHVFTDSVDSSNWFIDDVAFQATP